MFVRINNENFNVKVCNSRREISEGMMGKEFIGFDGMLFFMGNGNHSFWMKNCIIPLDIIFIDSDLIITEIHSNCEPCDTPTCESYHGYGKYVLEIEGGRCQDENIKIGDSVSFIFRNH
jgi:uncharacterized membrane protein (UPF0127 family)